MNIWTDGFAVLLDQARGFFSILITILWGQIIMIAYLKRASKNQLTPAEYFSLSAAGWILPVTIWAALMFFGFILFGGIAKTLVTTLSLLALFYALPAGKPSRSAFWVAALFIFLLALSVILRLAFLNQTILPLYFDSAEHYRIIKYFAEDYLNPRGSLRLGTYYHIGYHFLTAALSKYYSLGIVDTMLVFGQIILALLPFSLFFIIKQETQSNAAAVFACLLAGFGWHMPSHLINWGKYPALLSLVAVHFVLNIGYLIYKNEKLKIQKPILYSLLGLGVLISALIHTRSLIVFAVMAISLLLTKWRSRSSLLYQQLALLITLCILILQFTIVRGNALLAPLFGVYLGQDLFVTGLVIFLFIFSAQAFPSLTFFLLVSLAMLLAGLFIPIPALSASSSLTLVDRPYLQMLLYLPLSIFGGLGLAGLLQFLQRFSFQLSAYPKIALAAVLGGEDAVLSRIFGQVLKWMPQLLTLSIFVFVILNAKINHQFYPSDCCQIITRDDLAAFQWIEKNLPRKAVILIASTSMSVASFEDSNAPRAGLDGGIWIQPLINRRTKLASPLINFDSLKVHADKCRRNIDYIYAAAMPQSFNPLQLDAHPELYQVIFSLPAAKVYQVIGCR